MSGCQRLLGYVLEPADDTVWKVEPWVAELGAKRQWLTGGVPVFVNEISDPGDPGTGDEPIATLGFLLELSPPDQDPATRTSELRACQDVAFLIHQVASFSAHSGISFEFELDGVYVGKVVNGVLNKTLQEGLLDEWARRVGINATGLQ